MEISFDNSLGMVEAHQPFLASGIARSAQTCRGE
tara:strand:- start:1342 stop:1443 length:102 start_codon:yes stop_codon:yes gene_type:complete